VIRKNVSDCGGIVDLGSGSGFPGIVMAILLKEKTIYLIESIRKKALFLKKVNDSLGLDVQIINQRIENVDFGFVEKPIITASFLDSIEQLIGIIRNNFKEPCRLITIRGDEKKTIGTDGIIIKKTGVEKVWMESWPSLENKIVYEVLFE
jgi:16S rRNA (guanine(527)-N(7))-methyltransferase RsmG